MADLITLDEFIANQQNWPRNAYVKVPGFESFYVRRTERYIEGQKYTNVIDLANITADRPGEGAFTRFVADFRVKHPDMHLYVENALDTRFQGRLLALGFRYVGPTALCPCYFLAAGESTTVADLDIWKVFHELGWTDLWYANPGGAYRPAPHPRDLLDGRWHAGVWTGPQHDLICVKQCSTNAEAEIWLSPGGQTPEDAAKVAIDKFKVLAGASQVCQRCGFVGGWDTASLSKHFADWCSHCREQRELPR